MNRRQFLFSAMAAGGVYGQTGRKPNIVFIMADDMGYGDLGCYGQKHIKTPNMDRLATEGTRFTNAYAGCTVCAPSRSVLMTGMHMGHTSIRSNPGGVPLLASDYTVAQTLKAVGYTCGCIGKWGLGDLGTDGVPSKHGFDRFFGYLHQVHAHSQYPGFLIEDGEIVLLNENRRSERAAYAPELCAQTAVQFVQEHAQRPFFLYAAFTLPHMELLAPKPDVDEYSATFPEPKAYRDPNQHYADQPYPRSAYAAMVTKFDSYVGRILDMLKANNLENDTIVFVTSDNGSATALWDDGGFFDSTAGLRGHKQNLYEGGIRVPMIVRWPGKVPKAKVSDFPWMFVDFMATAAEIAGTKPPLGIDGQSVLPALLGKAQKPAEFLYWELPKYDNKTGTFPDEIPMQAVRMGDWKAVRPKSGAPLELYNLKNDPKESTDVAKQQPAVLASVEKYLKTARTKPRPQKQPANLMVPTLN